MAVLGGHLADGRKVAHDMVSAGCPWQGQALRYFWCHDLGTTIVVPGSWYQVLITKILVPRAWYQDPRWGLGRSEGQAKRGPELIVIMKNGAAQPSMFMALGVFIGIIESA